MFNGLRALIAAHDPGSDWSVTFGDLSAILFALAIMSYALTGGMSEVELVASDSLSDQELKLSVASNHNLSTVDNFAYQLAITFSKLENSQVDFIHNKHSISANLTCKGNYVFDESKLRELFERFEYSDIDPSIGLYVRFFALNADNTEMSAKIATWIPEGIADKIQFVPHFDSSSRDCVTLVIGRR